MHVAALRCARASPSPPPAQTFCLPRRVILMSSPNTQRRVGWAGTSRCALQTSSPPVSSPPLCPFYLEHPPLAEDRHRFLPGHALCSAPHKEFGCFSHQRCLSCSSKSLSMARGTQTPPTGPVSRDKSGKCHTGRESIGMFVRRSPGMDHPAWICHSPVTPG